MNDVPPSRPPGRPEDKPREHSEREETINPNPALGVGVGSSIGGAAEAAKGLPPGATPVLVEGLGVLAVSKGATKGHLRIEAPGRAFMDERPFGFWTKLTTAKSFAKSFPGVEEDRVAEAARAVQVAFEAHKEDLRALVYGSRHGGVEKPALNKEVSEGVERLANELLDRGDLLREANKLMARGMRVPGQDKVRFVVGERGPRRLIWTNLVGSAKTPYPQFTIIVGPPGDGKTNSVETPLLTLPEGLVRRRGYLTGAAIRYGGDTENAVLYLQELRGDGEQDLRLLSPYDGGFLAEIAVKDRETGRMTTEIHDVRCRGFITSTAEGLPSPQLLRRLWLVSVDSSPELTHRINKCKAAIRGGRWRPAAPEDVEVVKRAVELLQPYEVVIPFSTEVLEVAAWDRSTLDRLFDLISIITNLYQRRRPITADGKLVALPYDLHMALEIAEETLKETIAHLPKGHLKILQAVVELVTEGKAEGKKEEALPTAKMITKHTQISQKTVYNYARDLIILGYLTGTDKKPKKYEPTEKALASYPKSLRDNVPWPDVEKKTIEALNRLVPNSQGGEGDGDVHHKFNEHIYLAHPPWEKRTTEKEGKEESNNTVEKDSSPLKEIGQEKPLNKLEEHEKAVLSYVRRNASQRLTVTNVIAGLAPAGVEPETTRAVVEHLLDANSLKKDNLGFLDVVEGAAR